MWANSYCDTVCQGEGEDEGQFKLAPLPQSSPVEGEEEENNRLHD